ncbi:MAG: hypothetical protein FWG51_05670, partial [Firmicutes bacterium]|nr:hypothetical protein [Bacillota bacterium]
MKKLINFKLVAFSAVILLCSAITFGLVKNAGIFEIIAEKSAEKTAEALALAYSEKDYEKLRALWDGEANYDFEWDSSTPFYDENDVELGRGAIKSEEPSQDQDADTLQNLAPAMSAAAALPAAYDLSSDKYFPVIGNQGSLGSCAAWSTTYYTYTYEVARLKNNDVKAGGKDSPYIYSPKWTYNFVNLGMDEGGNTT